MVQSEWLVKKKKKCIKVDVVARGRSFLLLLLSSFGRTPKMAPQKMLLAEPPLKEIEDRLFFIIFSKSDGSFTEKQTQTSK